MADICCYTDVQVETFSFLWVIRHFELAVDGAKPLKSPKFSGSTDYLRSQQLGGEPTFSTKPGLQTTCTRELQVGSVASAHRPTLEWELRLIYGTDVSLKLALVSHTGKGRTWRVKFRFAILNEDNEEKYAIENQVESFKESGTRSGWDFDEPGLSKFIKKSTLLSKKDELLPGGTLRLYCEFEVKDMYEVVHTVFSKDMFALSVPPYNPQLGSVLREGLFSDFTVAAGDKEFKAHKVILAARSPVFKRMIESPMQESRENRVEITDFDPKVVQELLTYIYTGEAPNIKSVLHDLLRIADKYEVQHLKIMCGKVFLHSLDVNNVAETLVLADLHSIQQLKSACLRFTVAHIPEVSKTTGWNTLKTNNPELYIEILEAQQLGATPTKKPM